MNAHLLSTNVANYNCEYARIGELIATNNEQITWYINTSTYIKQCLYIETIIQDVLFYSVCQDLGRIFFKFGPELTSLDA